MAQASRARANEPYQDLDEQLKSTMALIQRSFQSFENVDIEAIAMRRASGDTTVAINSFGTAGTAGTLSGCFGTAGTFGSLGATDLTA